MRGKIIKRIGRIGLTAAVIVMLTALLTSLNPTRTTVDAASLKHIDEIVAASGTFNVLEIVPNTDESSFGYYVEGQEPISKAIGTLANETYTYTNASGQAVTVTGWKAKTGGTATAAARGTYVNDLFRRLASKGVLDNGTTTLTTAPLRSTYYVAGTNSYYTEAYSVSDPLNWNTLHLKTLESGSLTGTFTPAVNGALRANYTYARADGGGYTQNIAYYAYTAAPSYGQGTSYYNPVFTEIAFGTDLTGWDNVAVYTKDATGNYVVDTANNRITVKDYMNGGGFDASVKYYYSDPTQSGAPGNYNYAAIVSTSDNDDAPNDGYITPASGSSYFSRSIASFNNVGTGGNYAYANTGSSTYTVNYTDIYYKAGYVNNNLFKASVFGLTAANMNTLNVTVNVLKASDVTAADISAAGMIYIAAGTVITRDGAPTAYSAANDIQDARAVDLYNYAANLNPVIVDYPIIQGITSSTPAASIKNIQKLCLLCLQSTLTPTTQTSLSGLTVSWAALSALTAGSETDKTLVSNNVYCFNAFNDQTLGGQPNIASLVSSLFNDPFSAGVYGNGFTAVLTEIQNENFLRQIAGQTDFLPETVSVSTTIRHIVNYRGQRQTNQKTAIKVLDIEPAKVTSSSWLTPDTVRAWINNTLPLDQITVIHLTTGEFIGKIDDINETYDMIYIGMSTESLNTSGGGNNGSTVFNDSAMNGLIYTNIGDKYRATIEMAGIRAQDYVTINGTTAINNATGTNANLFRFSGNDITKTTVTKLQKFAQAGYPVILADGFVNGTAINTAKVDSSSYMYQAATGIYGTYTNVMKQSYAASNTATVIKYLNVSKPAVLLTAKPVEYADNSSATLTANPDDGYYYLSYVFSVHNVTDTTPLTTTYTCKLYIDLNADGRYADSEALDDIEIHRVSDGALILPQLDAGGKEYYALPADTPYQVTRQMPEDYVGIIPWKLECIKNGADQIHASAFGFTRIAAGSAMQTVKVLQIMQAGTSGSKLNLSQQLTVDPSGSNTQLRGLNNRYYKGIYGKLIADLQDFNVSIDEIDTNVLEAKGSSSVIGTYLNGYDMVIIGFNDCYDGISPNSAAAIVSYIGSGKSVLFTHDTTSLSQVPSNFPMVTDTVIKTLNSTDVVYNNTTSVFRSIDGNINWSGAYSTTAPISVKKENPSNTTYVMFMASMPTSSNEQDYYDACTGRQAYSITNSSGYSVWTMPSAYSDGTSGDFTTFKSQHSSSTFIYFSDSAISGWYGTGTNNGLYNITVTGNFVKFVGGTKYLCTGLTYNVKSSTNVSKPSNKFQDIASDSAANKLTWKMYCLYNDTTPDSYAVVGTYNGAANTYTISSATWYPDAGAPFPQSTLYDATPGRLSTVPNNITDWGYYFNTIIRDAVGLDRYGVTNPALRSLVDVATSMPSQNINTVLGSSRSVAFTPKSARGTTVPEFQGYTNYALMRFAGTNTYRYTNNNYSNRETTNVSQVNKGQITTYPYNVNTALFSGNDSTITGYGGSYMKIGLTHEQYFQINMNTDDIVVWYCMSNYSSYNSSTHVVSYDDSSYYDDVPNDCVNAYYIYNKGNVTYSGVGHSSNASLYTGSSIGQEYVNEAKLFVNTMIAAFQSGVQTPSIKIKKDSRGTSDLKQKYATVDVGSPSASGDSTVLEESFGSHDESRAVYFKISDPNIGVSKTITLTYYVSDPNGAITGIDPTNATQKVSLLPSMSVYNIDGTAVSTLKGGYLYKLFLPDRDGTVSVLDQLKSDSTYSFRIYVKVTTTIAGSQVLPSIDYLDIKKQQLFELS